MANCNRPFGGPVTARFLASVCYITNHLDSDWGLIHLRQAHYRRPPSRCVPTQTGDETPPELAGEDACATKTGQGRKLEFECHCYPAGVRHNKRAASACQCKRVAGFTRRLLLGTEAGWGPRSFPGTYFSGVKRICLIATFFHPAVTGTMESSCSPGWARVMVPHCRTR